MREDRTGMLNVRALMQDGSARPLRAVIRTTDDVNKGIQRKFAISAVDGVCPELDTRLRAVRGESDR